jgi:hypothetical protein
MALLVPDPGDEDGEEDESYHEENDDVCVPEAMVAFGDLPGIDVRRI